MPGSLPVTQDRCTVLRLKKKDSKLSEGWKNHAQKCSKTWAAPVGYLLAIYLQPLPSLRIIHGLLEKPTINLISSSLRYKRCRLSTGDIFAYIARSMEGRYCIHSSLSCKNILRVVGVQKYNKLILQCHITWPSTSTRQWDTEMQVLNDLGFIYHMGD